MLIGRLTAVDATQAAGMVDKIIYYEGHPPNSAWNNNALLVADDDTAAFATASDELAGILPLSYTAHKVYVADYYLPNNPTIDITNHVNAGSLLVDYMGHGNSDMWGTWRSGHTFDLPNIAALANTNKYLVVTVGNCLNGFFAGPATSVGEQFVGQATTGAVAVWAPADLGDPGGHQALLSEFYRVIFRDGVYQVGAAAVAAGVNAYALDYSLAELIQSYVLFGDPAMKLGLPTNYPYLLSTAPTNGAKAVRPGVIIHVQFSKRMNPATVSLSIPGAPGVTFTASWNADRTAVTYSHMDPLPLGKTLVATISGQDGLGNGLGAGLVPATWSFTVAAKQAYLPMLRR